eukprot:15437023-Alexandrium_andersonii.AAC.1
MERQKIVLRHRRAIVGYVVHEWLCNWRLRGASLDARRCGVAGWLVEKVSCGSRCVKKQLGYWVF